MKDDDYWKLSDKNRADIDVEEARKTQSQTERYYYWYYCRSYGWRQMGRGDGYATLKDLKKYHSEEMAKVLYRITKARII